MKPPASARSIFATTLISSAISLFTPLAVHNWLGPYVDWPSDNCEKSGSLARARTIPPHISMATTATAGNLLIIFIVFIVSFQSSILGLYLTFGSRTNVGYARITFLCADSTSQRFPNWLSVEQNALTAA